MTGNTITLLIIITLLGSDSPQQYIDPFDIIIKNGRILDGLGNPWFIADIGIRDGRIVDIGNLNASSADNVIYADNLYVAPGFIDVHSHASNGLISKELSQAHSLLAQGVTTVVINHDGGGPTNLATQENDLLLHGLGVNVIQLVPHGSVRRQVMGHTDRKPTAIEMDEMKNLVYDGMASGAFGLSSGLFYVPGSFSTTDEIIELAKVVAIFDGIHSSHIRDESDYSIGILAAVEEIIQISLEAEIPSVISHVKTLGPRVWGLSNTLVQQIESARENGLKIYADQYPYTASATSLAFALIPSAALEGGMKTLRKRLNDSEDHSWIREGILNNLDRRGGADRILLRRFSHDDTFEGRSLQEISDSLQTNPADLVIDLIKIGNPDIISFNMLDNDVNLLMQQPWTMTSSDGELVAVGDGYPHPRSFGAFSRKLKKYAIEDGVISLEAAIRSMTSLPAEVFGLHNRGVISRGSIADMAIFDLDRLRDTATYTDPHRFAEGMVHVLINGQFAIEDGDFTNDSLGQILKNRIHKDN
ncbi:MAG: amidohydrolase family protein [Balneolales bacterium]